MVITAISQSSNREGSVTAKDFISIHPHRLKDPESTEYAKSQAATREEF
jgi:hypothetical protein